MSTNRRKSHQVAASPVEELKRKFRKFDTDHSGTIDREELAVILKTILPDQEQLRPQEFNALFCSLAKNGTDEIEYDELIDWVMKPSTQVCQLAGELFFFDLKAVLLPLFKLYDRNGDGNISTAEFLECHSILQNAIILNETTTLDPDFLRGDMMMHFAAMDTNQDRNIGLDEFVQFNRDAMAESGLSMHAMKMLVHSITKQMDRVLKLSAKEQRGALTKQDVDLLQRILSNVAKMGREIWNTTKASLCEDLETRHDYRNSWLDPPPGINVEKLKRAHLSSFPPKLGIERVVNIEMEVLCCPELPIRNDPDYVRTWLGRVERTVTFANTKKVTTPVKFFVWAIQTFEWELIEEELEEKDPASEFSECWTGFSRELQFYCILKNTVNFGLKMYWKDIQKAFSQGVRLGVIDQDAHTKHDSFFRQMVWKKMEEEGFQRGDKTGLKAALEETATLSPSAIMCNLAELNIFKMSSVWADIMDLEGALE